MSLKYYLGRVYRNSNFGVDGTIDVLLFQQAEKTGLKSTLKFIASAPLKLFKMVLPSLLDETGETIESENLTQKCLIVGNGLGNGYNTGEIAIPQIGTVGLIAEVDKIESNFANVKYAWLGGLYGCKKNGEKVILPSDDTDNAQLDSEDKSLTVDLDNGDVIKNSDYITSGMKIIKTKTCNVSDYKNVNQDDVDYKVIPTENTFVLKQTKAGLRHNSYKQEEKKVTVKATDENGKETTVEQTKKEYIKTSYGQLMIDDNSFSMLRRSKDDDDKESVQEISFNNNILNISNTGGSEERKLTIKFDKDGSMLISSDGNLKITALENLQLHGKTINITGDEGIDIVNSSGIMTIGDNNVSLIKVVYDLISFMTTGFKTIGNQALQTTAPQNTPKLSQISSDMLKGFATTVSSNKITHS